MASKRSNARLTCSGLRCVAVVEAVVVVVEAQGKARARVKAAVRLLEVVAAVLAAQAATVGSTRWFGTNPHPSVFIIGARDGGGDALSDLITSQPKLCGGPLRFFDDDSRFTAGLTPITNRYVRQRPGKGKGKGQGQSGGCTTLVDTSAYLHTRWAAPRIAAALKTRNPPPKFVVVLGDPVDRAVRHWRSINAALTRPAGLPLRGSAAKGTGGERAQMTAYTNGTTLAKKVRNEATELSQCFKKTPGHASNGRSSSIPATQLVSAWQECTTRACNWVECILGGGLYGPQLRHWLKHFGSDRFLLLEEEQLRTQPEFVASSLTGFLELPKALDPSSIAWMAGNHSTGRATVVGEQLRRALHQFYDEHAPHVRKLFEELAPKGSNWASASWLNRRSAPNGEKVALVGDES